MFWRSRQLDVGEHCAFLRMYYK